MIDYENLLSHWRNFACALWEFIENEIDLNSEQRQKYQEIMNEYGEE